MPEITEPSGEQVGSEYSPGVDYEALHEEALELNHQSFMQRAERETDEAFASDLGFAAQASQALKESGGLALVVGGYARDEALERITGEPQASKDIDIEVYGTSFDSLSQQLASFGPTDLVGASFGIIKLKNPETGHMLDFSIPREDSKIDKGHRGFKVTGNPDMTVREAARRRDLTINALALNPLTGELIDEYGGLQDLKDGVLRATDPELFGDDPLRVLRVMQFAGRFNFRVDPVTAEICRSLDLAELPGERIGEEWLKLMTKSSKPSVGLEVAKELGILKQLHPELDVLSRVEQEPEWHPEGNVWNHTKLVADAAAKVVRQKGLEGEEALVVLFGALCHDLGKATTTEMREKSGVMRITSHGHEAAGIEPSKSFLKSINLKGSVIDKIVPIVREHLYHVHNPEPTDKQLARFAQRLQPASIKLWDLVSRCDSNGRGGEFVEKTSSYRLFERSQQLNIQERPAPKIVTGKDLMGLGLKPGVQFGAILEHLYEAQLDGRIGSVEEGIKYYREHEGEIGILAEKAEKEYLEGRLRP
jgi:tRNA nucleotidyltransferase (CCA-adding enzyme)